MKINSSDDENEMLYSPPKKSSPKPSPMTTRKYMGLSLIQSGSHNSPPSLPADFSDLASVTSNDVDLTSSPGSPRRKVIPVPLNDSHELKCQMLTNGNLVF